MVVWAPIRAVDSFRPVWGRTKVSIASETARLNRLLRHAAEASGATLISVHVHRFEPHGLSGVAILAESHLSVHTWPELGFAAVDAFTCGDHVDPSRAVEIIRQGFGASHASSIEIDRGMQNLGAVTEAVEKAQQPYGHA